MYLIEKNGMVLVESTKRMEDLDEMALLGIDPEDIMAMNM
jgi:hypothetical protein